jgi:hypothetical protein
MPDKVNVNQLIGKTFYPLYKLNYYDVFDINNDGDNAKSSGNFKVGESFVMDSYLLPIPAQTKYGIKYAKRSNLYLTFYRGKNYYAVIYNPNVFSLHDLQQQGVKTIEQEMKEEAEANKTPIDKVLDVLGAGSDVVKKLLIFGVVIIAIGYLAPKFKKN